MVGRKVAFVRHPTIVYGLFNQLFALFAAVDLAKLLGRNQLVVANFYVNFKNRQNSVPLSRIIDLKSLLLPTLDWIPNKEPTHSLLLKHGLARPSNCVQLLQKENHIQDLEIGCCFLFPVPGHDRAEHIKKMRFHPIFYQIISSFLEKYPKYQVVHYRMESDFTGHFFKGWRFNSLAECRKNLYKKYQENLAERFDPTIPTLVVSHYYKDPKQPRDHDLKWDNLVHFKLNPQQKTQLFRHLQLPETTPIREVEAVIDFILCTTPNVCNFIGCGGSTFSGSVCLFRNNQNCFNVHPVKMA
jgi:hypothetical protein